MTLSSDIDDVIQDTSPLSTLTLSHRTLTVVAALAIWISTLVCCSLGVTLGAAVTVSTLAPLSSVTLGALAPGAACTSAVVLRRSSSLCVHLVH